MNRAANTAIPAVVVGGGLNALGIVRSLAAAGVAVLVIDTDAQSPAMRSRHGSKLVVAKLEGSGFVDRLLELASGWDRAAMLFVTEEKSVIAVSEYRERLTPRFHVRMPAHDLLMQLMHKQGFQQLAESCAAPVPRTVRLQSLADLALADKLTFPCVFKPSQKDYAYGARFKKAYKVTSTDELARLYHEIHPVTADMVVQEWIEGADSDIYFCLQYIGADGEPVSSFTGRKIRSWPPRIGGTASCTAAWEDAAELKEMTSHFFRQVGFTGMGSMEYKRDVRDGRFYMVEPTVGRTDFQEEVAALNGVNIPYAAYCYELGLAPAAETREAVPRIWRDPLSDRWSFEEGDGVADARSQAHAVFDAYWRWNDPRPWLDFTWNRVAAKLGRKA